MFHSSGLNTAAEGSVITDPTEDPLYLDIHRMDSLLFDAFNRHDLDMLKVLFAPDVEFYHDMGGLSDYTQTMEGFKRVFDRKDGLHRLLIPGTMEVYPIKDFGAIETGQHQFCHMENGTEDCGTFKFIHIWQFSSDGWKLKRVVSYDH